jgi:chemotaxis protein MotC
MILRHRTARLGLAALWLAGAVGIARAETEAELEPYQMVRSLQLVQDRIAGGDHAALPMQRKLLEMIDQRFRAARSGDFVDERNYQALLVYAMSGGNPQTIDMLLSRLHLDETDRALGTGILAYLNGEPQAARTALENVDPLALTSDLGAFFALVKGSISASDDPGGALHMFDEVRLLGPGTLVEEAALRRSLPLEARSRDAVRFLRTSSQYVRRYLRSPYASQFADEFVAGVVALHETIELPGIEDVVSLMDPERQKVIYLRLARRAAIEGMTDLTEYASAKADAIRIDGVGPDSDPRAQLYSSLATVTSETVGEVLPKLKAIDRSRLSESDRKLLEAAEAIAAEVTAEPPTPAETIAARPPEDRSAEAAADAEPVEAELAEARPAEAEPVGAEPAEAQPDDGLPDAEPVDAEPVDAEPVDAEPVEAPGAAPETASNVATSTDPAAAEAADPADAVMVDARKKLDEIDKLLKDTTQ